MPTTRALPPSVLRLRARMDRLNARLVALLQARAHLALAIGRAKARHGLGAADPARERRMLSSLLAGAPSGFPRAELSRVLRAVFAASRRLVVAERGQRPARASRR